LEYWRENGKMELGLRKRRKNERRRDGRKFRKLED
jgi:hypothetical protein